VPLLGQRRQREEATRQEEVKGALMTATKSNPGLEGHRDQFAFGGRGSRLL
jgi:hypothetical protein